MAGIGSSARPAPPVNSGGGSAPMPSMGSPIPPARRQSAPMTGMGPMRQTIPQAPIAPARPGSAPTMSQQEYDRQVSAQRVGAGMASGNSAMGPWKTFDGNDTAGMNANGWANPFDPKAMDKYWAFKKSMGVK